MHKGKQAKSLEIGRIWEIRGDCRSFRFSERGWRVFSSKRIFNSFYLFGELVYVLGLWRHEGCAFQNFKSYFERINSIRHSTFGFCCFWYGESFLRGHGSSRTSSSSKSGAIKVEVILLRFCKRTLAAKPNNYNIISSLRFVQIEKIKKWKIW